MKCPFQAGYGQTVLYSRDAIGSRDGPGPTSNPMRFERKLLTPPHHQGVTWLIRWHPMVKCHSWPLTTDCP
jgi:hypothetical protein